MCPGPRPNPANPSIHCTGECGFGRGQGIGIGVSRPHNHSEICSLETLHCLGCAPGARSSPQPTQRGCTPRCGGLGLHPGAAGLGLIVPPAAGGAEARSAGGPRGGAGVDQGVSPPFHPIPAPRSPPGQPAASWPAPLRSASRLLTKKDPSHSSGRAARGMHAHPALRDLPTPLFFLSTTFDVCPMSGAGARSGVQSGGVPCLGGARDIHCLCCCLEGRLLSLGP